MAIRRLALAGASLGISLASISCKSVAPHPPVKVVLDARDSPVTVEGGSIYASVDGKSVPWKFIKKEKMYSAISTNSDYIVLTGLVDIKSGTASPGLIQNTGGWLIQFSTQDVSKKPKPKSNTIFFCSDLSQSGACAGASLPADKMVYLDVEKDKRWEERSPRELHFHDTDKTCDDSNNTEGPCDVITSITIKTVSASSVNGVTYKCVDEKSCSITVGTPLQTLKE
jgi:hypothetical protein